MLAILLFLAAGLLAYGTLANIASVGKPRSPLTGTTVAVATVINALIITSLVIAGFNLN